jgi:membrane associated rhomboid family serine protease
MFNLTPVVRNIIIINVVIFLAQNIAPIRATGCLEGGGLTSLISLWPFGTCAFAPYQFFTYMFAHGGFGHIFFNMLALASFAPILENYWGDKKFLIFYLATGIGAGVIYGASNFFFNDADPYVLGPMLGASGAIYGILMAFGMVFPNLEIMLLFPPIPIKAKYMVFLMGGMTFLLDRSGAVAHVAHFGGAFIAFLLISYWKSQGNNRR